MRSLVTAKAKAITRPAGFRRVDAWFRSSVLLNWTVDNLAWAHLEGVLPKRLMVGRVTPCAPLWVSVPACSCGLNALTARTEWRALPIAALRHLGNTPRRPRRVQRRSLPHCRWLFLPPALRGRDIAARCPCQIKNRVKMRPARPGRSDLTCCLYWFRQNNYGSNLDES